MKRCLKVTYIAYNHVQGVCESQICTAGHAVYSSAWVTYNWRLVN
jgi:hypothetical protein